MENRGAAGKMLLFVHVTDSSVVHRSKNRGRRDKGVYRWDQDHLFRSCHCLGVKTVVPAPGVLSTKQMVLLVEKDDVLGVSLG